MSGINIGMRNWINLVESVDGIDAPMPLVPLPHYWYRGVEEIKTSHWKVREDKLPTDLVKETERYRTGAMYELYNHEFRVSRSYAGMSNWGFGVYVTNSIDWAKRYGNNILVCRVDPADILHISFDDFRNQTPDTLGGRLAILLHEQTDSMAEQAAIMYKMVKKIDRKAKALFVQTDHDGSGQMCVFNKNYIDAKWFFETM